MSFKATEWAWEQPLDGRKKLLLLAIAHEANKSDACSVPQERLADSCRCSARAPVGILSVPTQVGTLLTLSSTTVTLPAALSELSSVMERSP
jgi:hypothetical protein